MNQRLYSLLIALLVAGAALRIEVNDVAEYSPDDEAIYVRTTVFLHQHGWSGYPLLVEDYITHPAAWLYPNPSRWGYYALTSSVCACFAECGPRALASLSTAAGILSILLVFLIGRELLGAEVAVIAAAIAVSSPLQLAMGRRALQDEVFCAAILLSLWLGCLVVKTANGRQGLRRILLAAAVVSITFTLSIKESFLLLYPAYLLFLMVLAPSPRVRVLTRLAPLIVLPPLLDALVMIGLSGGVKRCFRLLQIVATAASSINSAFALQFSSGPFHRPLLDLTILSPLVIILAIAGAARSDDNRALRALAAFAGLTLVTFGLLALKNVRYVIPVDPIARILAASFVASLPKRPWLAWAVLGDIAATELRLFYDVFELANVYDPVTDELLRALHSIP